MQAIYQSLEDHAQEIKTRGYTVIENVLDKQQIKSACAALDEIFAREAEIGQKRGWHNRMHMVAFMLLQKDPFFRSFFLGPKVLPLMQMLLGEDCILSSLNGLSMIPGGEPQQLHRDSLGIPGHVLTINALYTLDDFRRENGCTRVVPGTQDYDSQLLGSVDKTDFQALEEKAVYLEAPAGSVIVYNGAIVHGGSGNTTNEPRRALHPFFVRSWIKPQWDIPASLSPQVINELSEEQKKLFGFYSCSRRFDYRTNEVILAPTSQAQPIGFRQRARHLKDWILSQAALGRRN
jgi:ectoine hydroxylase-related dioxygenase (phytanoyl-CoA dioxygenase family)